MSVEIMPQEQHRFHVNFELRAVEDRAESMEAGHPVFKDVEYAIITMPGGQLVVDKVIDEALLYEWKNGSNRKPPSPFALTAYQAWKDGREIPVNGIDLKNWPGVTPAQIKMCHGTNIYSVEDLAEANDEAKRRMGMGALALINKAKSYLENAEDNKASEAISALQVRLDALEAENDRLKDENGTLRSELEQDEPKKRGKKK